MIIVEIYFPYLSQSITLWPFILYHEKPEGKWLWLRRHEWAHVREIEMKTFGNWFQYYHKYVKDLLNGVPHSQRAQELWPLKQDDDESYAPWENQNHIKIGW